jgi:hypothetical protein
MGKIERIQVSPEDLERLGAPTPANEERFRGFRAASAPAAYASKNGVATTHVKVLRGGRSNNSGDTVAGGDVGLPASLNFNLSSTVRFRFSLPNPAPCFVAAPTGAPNNPPSRASAVISTRRRVDLLTLPTSRSNRAIARFGHQRLNALPAGCAEHARGARPGKKGRRQRPTPTRLKQAWRVLAHLGELALDHP